MNSQALWLLAVVRMRKLTKLLCVVFQSEDKLYKLSGCLSCGQAEENDELSPVFAL
jgi:hypothetical protein